MLISHADAGTYDLAHGGNDEDEDDDDDDDDWPRDTEARCHALAPELRLNVMGMAQIWSPREQQPLLQSKTLPPCLCNDEHGS